MYLDRPSSFLWSDAVAEPGSGADSRETERARRARACACRRILVLFAATILTSSLSIAPVYATDDIDGDGVLDSMDNCPSDANSNQEDTDADGVGDACDNAPNDPNPGQEDNDGDGVGNVVDNCPDDPNRDQGDTDGDRVGDQCDNAVDAPNPGQEDYDNDGTGDVVDNCPDLVNPGQQDFDEDGLGDVCDSDDDNDRVMDSRDNCPLVLNSDQGDLDLDGLGNACDPMFMEGNDELFMIVGDVTEAVKVIVRANPPGGNGLIAKLTSHGGVLSRVFNAVAAYDGDLIDLHTYREELELALKILDTFDDQLSAKISKGQIDEPEAIALETASENVGASIMSLMTPPGM